MKDKLLALCPGAVAEFDASDWIGSIRMAGFWSVWSSGEAPRSLLGTGRTEESAWANAWTLSRREAGHFDPSWDPRVST